MWFRARRRGGEVPRRRCPPGLPASSAGGSSLGSVWSAFFDFNAMKKAFPDLLKVGLPNTLILAVTSGVIGTILGLLLAVAGLS